MENCTPEYIIDQQVAAYQAHDSAAFAAFYAPDAVIYEHPGTVLMTGREEIAASYGASFAASPNVQLTIATRIVNGDYVIDKEMLKDGAFEGHATVIYRVDGCLIGRADILPLVVTSQ